MTAPRTKMRPSGAFGATVPRVRGDFTWVYLWGAPLRLMHWIAAVCLVALVITGLYIGRPYINVGLGEASKHFFMGYVRLTHFLAAAIIVMTGIVRFYWLFAGNRFERWRALFPMTPKNLNAAMRVAKSYLTLRPDEQPRFVGHNPLAQNAYTTIYVATAMMVCTGFAMYGQANPGGFFETAFAWVPALLGGIQNVRLLHHVLTWFYPIFVPIHIYLAIRADYIERAGALSSIFTGGRFVESRETFEDFDLAGAEARAWPTGEHPAWQQKAR